MYKGKKISFPSYKKIYNEIKDEKKKIFDKKINKFYSNIQKVKAGTQFIQSYRKDRILKCDPQNQFQDISVESKKKYYCQKESLNQLLENDEQLNNYEIDLKFRKKVLQRELLEEKENSDSKQRGNQQFFKNLYDQKYKDSKKKSSKDLFFQRQNILMTKKKLKQQYGQYLQKIANTNIVKFRIFNDKSFH